MDVRPKRCELPKFFRENIFVPLLYELDASLTCNARRVLSDIAIRTGDQSVKILFMLSGEEAEVEAIITLWTEKESYTISAANRYFEPVGWVISAPRRMLSSNGSAALSFAYVLAPIPFADSEPAGEESTPSQPVTKTALFIQAVFVIAVFAVITVVFNLLTGRWVLPHWTLTSLFYGMTLVGGVMAWFGVTTKNKNLLASGAFLIAGAQTLARRC